MGSKNVNWLLQSLQKVYKKCSVWNIKKAGDMPFSVVIGTLEGYSEK